MKYIISTILFLGFLITPAFAQEVNPSLIIETMEISAEKFNTVMRNAPIIPLDNLHSISWQVTIDNNLLYANPNGNAVFRIYDKDDIKFIEVGMGPQPENKFWVAVQTPDEGYIVVHKDLDRGWYPQAKSIVSFTDRAGLTVNNGARIVVTNLDIEKFEIESYSVHGMEGSTDPPAINSGVIIVEILSGDPGKNLFAFFPFYVAIGIGIIGATLYFTKKRS
ncbi:MAG: hypothetical protein MT332_02680 [Candidatus Nitrosopumilus limneticus]|nr:conserved exported protein of unknown function [Candidatus Nitrosopumilus limneticus]MDC4211937.1 hypothetical protein [Candidatus Nitrosopumilus limneticus]MDC4214683.1 hypothetical protein [Candidatus Nitrosopumilus limneticus]MDC4216248.1 hypothetical protein [Candidatus Nitrosopumilus limneticus]MDC4217909.1 hypothetical protein [Candidatus Nitrosopumilus limneticus]